jgi:hypothetical protein
MALETKVTCMECGGKFSLINNKHLDSHNLTQDAYEKKHPGAALRSAESLARKKEGATRANAGRIGIPRSAAVKDAIRNGYKTGGNSTKGIPKGPMSDSVKEKLSIKAKNAFSAGTRASPMLGKTHSEETKAKITNSLSGYKQTEEHVAKVQLGRANSGYDFGSIMRGKTHTEEALKKISEANTKMHAERRPALRQHMFEKFKEAKMTLLNDISENTFRLRCDTCDYEFNRTHQNFHPSKWSSRPTSCDRCFPYGRTSQAQIDVANFIRSLGETVIEDDREVIAPLELDIWIPERNIAFEYCGLYWHSEVYKKPYDHIYKMNKCSAKRIKLITIFEDEWVNNQAICESMIAARLGVYQLGIMNYHCVVKTLTEDQERDFLVANHMFGPSSTPSFLSVGLFYEGELVSLMSVKLSGGNMVISRMCTLLNTTVIRGDLTLLKYTTGHGKIDNLHAYADSRWDDGSTFSDLGFKKIEKSPVAGLWHVKKGLIVREKLDRNLTESETSGDWYRIYDCGNTQWEWNKF